MNHIPVHSSTIESIAHSPEDQRMEIKFKSGKTYAFGNVSEQDFEAFRLAPSTGKHFHATFKGNPKHALPQS